MSTTPQEKRSRWTKKPIRTADVAHPLSCICLTFKHPVAHRLSHPLYLQATG